MTTNDAYTLVQDAEEIGATWGEQEVDAWRDQHDGSMAAAPAWTRGTYCGNLPTDETRELVEAIIDLAAERVWNSYR